MSNQNQPQVDELQAKSSINGSARMYWIELEIGDICDVVAGGTPKASDKSNFAEPGTSVPWLTPADLSRYKSKFISHGARDLSEKGFESSSAKLMPEGTVLFSSRAPIGYVAIAQNPISTNQGFKNFVFTSDVFPSYAYYYLKSIRDEAESRGTGTTFKEISGSSAKKLPFMLPPLAEQKIIAEKLDTLLAQVEQTKARLDRIPGILKRFRQSVLSAAVSGKLTEEWRNDAPKNSRSVYLSDLDETAKTRRGVPENVIPNDDINAFKFPSDWGVWSISALLRKGVIEDLKDGNHGANHPKGKEFTQSGLPFITAAQMNDSGVVDYEGAPKVNGNVLAKLKVGFANVGDVIYSHKGTVGRVSVCNRECVLSPQTTYIRLNTKYISNNFYALMLKSSPFTNQVDSIKAQTTRDFVPITAHYSLFAVIPPFEEQIEIVSRVEKLFAFADQIESQVKSAQARVDRLTQSILAKAFRGELTAEWREQNPDLISGENSADALLAKIQAEREKLKPAKKTRTKKAKT